MSCMHEQQRPNILHLLWKWVCMPQKKKIVIIVISSVLYVMINNKHYVYLAFLYTMKSAFLKTFLLHRRNKRIWAF